MSYTNETFSNAVFEKLRAINPAIEASVIPRLSTMIQPALESLSQKVGSSPDRKLRNLLRRTIGTVTIASGSGSLATLLADSRPLLLDETAIRTADIRDADGEKLQMLADRGSLAQDRPDSFKYGAVNGQTLYTVNVDDGVLTVTANYIETDVGNLSGQLIPMLFDEMLGPWMQKAA
jgi:hypothetical protein